jgi:hypothetical protein
VPGIGFDDGSAPFEDIRMRHVFLGLVIGVMGSPVLADDVAPPASAACHLKQPEKSRLMGLGTVIGVQSPAVARADIPRREARLGGAIDPRYLDDPRVVVRQDDGRVQAFDVPQGLTVKVGSRVMLHGSYRSTVAPCAYVPILVTADLPLS